MTDYCSRQKVLITAALPYANGAIHFGHLAGAYLPADCYARFQRLLGNDVCFICGSDEYGVAISLSSEIHGRSPKDHVDIFHEKNKELFNSLLMSFDHYSRTTAPIHAETTKEFFLVLHEKGLVTPMESEQLFCEEDNRFYADRYVVGGCPKCGFSEARGDECTRCGASYEAIELKAPRTKRGNKPLTRKKTVHWYLRLDLIKKDLLQWIETKTSWKSNVVHFIKSYIEDLKPRAITRDMSWGIPVPLPEAEGKVLYVWFDAPIGYISATKEWAAQKTSDPDSWRRFWLEPSTKLVQFIGKDNIPFHAVIFPAMIMGQNLPFKMVDELPANEFYTLQGKQFSKSEGWYVDLEEFLQNFDPEFLRYTIASNAPETQDSEFTWKDFQIKVNTDLVGKFGNFIHRTLVFAKNNCAGQVPSQEKLDPIDHDFIAAIYEKISMIKEAYSSFKLRKACQLIMELAQLGNVYFDAKKPWAKVKDGLSEQDLIASRNTTINLCLDCVRLLSLAVRPILPHTSEKILHLLSQDFSTAADSHNSCTWDEEVSKKLAVGTILMHDPKPLFQKIEDPIIDMEQSKLSSKTESLPNNTAEVKPALLSSEEKSGELQASSEITFDDFQKVVLEVVEIVAAEVVPKSKKLLRLQVKGKNGQRQILSGIAQHYAPDSLIGKKVVACINLKPAKLMGLESQGMILAASSEEGKLELVEVQSSPYGASVQ